MPYLIHVSILLALCYIVYQSLLKWETFFRFNRWFILGSVLLCFILPIIEIPGEWSLRKTIISETAEPAPVQTVIEKPKIKPRQLECEVQPVSENISFEVEMSPSKAGHPSIAIPVKSISWKQLMKYGYFCGLAILFINLLIQLGAMFYMIFKNPKIRDGRYQIVNLKKDIAPFSFWNYIFLNPAKYDIHTRHQIIEHEKIHVTERHTLDILLMELLIIIQWYNPFAWLFRKATEDNLEFLTDRKMLTVGADKQTYQMSLLKVAVPNLPLNITTNYNQSTLKKRIVMMNTKSSSPRSGWKYFVLLPLLGLSVICLNNLQSDARESFNLKPNEPQVSGVLLSGDVKTENFAVIPNKKIASQLTLVKNVQKPQKAIAVNQKNDQQVTSTILGIAGKLGCNTKGQ